MQQLAVPFQGTECLYLCLDAKVAKNQGRCSPLGQRCKATQAPAERLRKGSLRLRLFFVERSSAELACVFIQHCSRALRYGQKTAKERCLPLLIKQTAKLHGSLWPCVSLLAHVVKSCDLNSRGLGYGTQAFSLCLRALPQTVAGIYNLPKRVELGLAFWLLLGNAKSNRLGSWVDKNTLFASAKESQV